MISIVVSLVIITTNVSSNRQYSCRAFQTAFELSLFRYVAVSFCRSFDTNPLQYAAQKHTSIRRKDWCGKHCMMDFRVSCFMLFILCFTRPI